jgi:hypothetical protein
MEIFRFAESGCFHLIRQDVARSWPNPVKQQPESWGFEASSRKWTHGGRRLGIDRKIEFPGVLVGTARAEDGDGDTAPSASDNR